RSCCARLPRLGADSRADECPVAGWPAFVDFDCVAACTAVCEDLGPRQSPVLIGGTKTLDHSHFSWLDPQREPIHLPASPNRQCPKNSAFIVASSHFRRQSFRHSDRCSDCNYELRRRSNNF